MRIAMADALAIAKAAWEKAGRPSTSARQFFAIGLSGKRLWVVSVIEASNLKLDKSEIFPDVDLEESRVIALITVHREVADLSQYTPEVVFQQPQTGEHS
mgnify:CR=1 FL=1